MAYLKKSTDNEELGSNQQFAPSLNSGAGGAPTTSNAMTGEVNQGSQTQRPGAGGFTNIQRYLSANSAGAQNVANRLSSNIDTAAGAARAAIEPARAQFNSAVVNPTFNPEANLNTQANLQYTGPSSITDVEAGRQAQAKANKVSEMAGLAGTTEGRAQLIRNTLPNNASTGAVNLDQFVLQNNQGAFDKLRQSVTQANAAPALFNQVAGEAANRAGEANRQAGIVRTQAQNLINAKEQAEQAAQIAAQMRQQREFQEQQQAQFMGALGAQRQQAQNQADAQARAQQQALDALRAQNAQQAQGFQDWITSLTAQQQADMQAQQTAFANQLTAQQQAYLDQLRAMGTSTGTQQTNVNQGPAGGTTPVMGPQPVGPVDRSNVTVLQPGAPGVDNATINEFVQGTLAMPNLSDAQKASLIRDAAARYNVSPARIAEATGFTEQQVTNYLTPRYASGGMVTSSGPVDQAIKKEWDPWSKDARTLDQATLDFLKANPQGGNFNGFSYTVDAGAPAQETESGFQEATPGSGKIYRTKLGPDGNIGKRNDFEVYDPTGNYQSSYIGGAKSWLDKNGWVVPVAMMAAVSAPHLLGNAAVGGSGAGASGGAIKTMGQLPALTASQAAALTPVAPITSTVAPLTTAGLGLGAVPSVGPGIGSTTSTIAKNAGRVLNQVMKSQNPTVNMLTNPSEQTLGEFMRAPERKEQPDLEAQALAQAKAMGLDDEQAQEVAMKAVIAVQGGMSPDLIAAIPMALTTLKPKAMAEGGPVHGPGGPTDDQVPAMLSAGEYVIPAQVVEAVGKDFFDGLLDQFKKGSN